MLKMWLTLASILLFITTACATPTPTVSTLTWNVYTDTNGKSFWVYWKDRGNATATYNNTNRTQITDVTKVSVLISAIVAAIHPSSMCFVLTAADSAGNESGFSNEVCGFTGFGAPSGLTQN